MPIVYPKTVIVLGAGASADLNYPCGNGLIDHIINDWKNTQGYSNAIKRIIYNNCEILSKKGNVECLPNDIRMLLRPDCREDILRDVDLSVWTEDLHHAESIDQFIYYRKDSSILAKLSILLTLSEFENPKFFNHQVIGHNNPDLRHDFVGVKRAWYHKLWANIIASSPNHQQLKWILDRICIVTFNYDRSLEYFLMKSILALFPESDIKPSDLPIIHVYGQIGSLDPANQLFNPYSPIDYRIRKKEMGHDVFKLTETSHNANIFKQQDAKILELALLIKTYGEKDNLDRAKYLRELILEVENVYFFGFSCQKQNLEVLFDMDQIKKGVNRPAKGYFDATCYQMSDEKIHEMRQICRQYFGSYNPKVYLPGRKPLKVSEYMDNYSIRL